MNKQNGRCPNLNGLFGTTVYLKDGSKVRADESYIRESVLYPQAKIVAGYDDIMPTFQGTGHGGWAFEAGGIRQVTGAEGWDGRVRRDRGADAETSADSPQGSGETAARPQTNAGKK